MACNSCAKGFSLLRKEKGCPGCGFSYCSSCLNNKVFIPKLNAEAKVCSKCKSSATKNSNSKSTVEPPDAYYRRLGVMDDKQPDNKAVTADPKDQHILERLQKLKEDKKITTTITDDDIRQRLQNIQGGVPSTSDAEIEARLAKLRGLPAESLSRKPLPVIIPNDTRTEQEQADDLLKQYIEQSNIDATYKNEFDGLVSDMELRIQKLKGTETSTSKVPSNEMTKEKDDSEDEEEAVKKIVEKIKAEASLDVDDDFSGDPRDELPFCEICNEDAKRRCLGCRYLFCKRCFLDHKDDDDGCNKYEPYSAPKNH